MKNINVSFTTRLKNVTILNKTDKQTTYICTAKLFVMEMIKHVELIPDDIMHTYYEISLQNRMLVSLTFVTA